MARNLAYRPKGDLAAATARWHAQPQRIVFAHIPGKNRREKRANLKAAQRAFIEAKRAS